MIDNEQTEEPLNAKADEHPSHPSLSLEPRARGYGIGGAYETPYRRTKPIVAKSGEVYGPLPHSGYYGTGAGSARFQPGQAGYNKELVWYGPQYGENTSGEPEDS
jgi:hypothetical protein